MRILSRAWSNKYMSQENSQVSPRLFLCSRLCIRERKNFPSPVALIPFYFMSQGVSQNDKWQEPSEVGRKFEIFKISLFNNIVGYYIFIIFKVQWMYLIIKKYSKKFISLSHRDGIEIVIQCGGFAVHVIRTTSHSLYSTNWFFTFSIYIYVSTLA